ncbi:alpha/beta hydrolase [Mycolicibacterium peregrinum]|uniref:alpha/beta hydrolase n=1 Tax=Mycolicibacterium peregrinum TaxID=43304 RepID=UPI003AAC3FE9
MLNWALLSGPLPVLLRLAGIGAAALLLARMVMAPRRGRTKAVMLAACALVAVVTTVIVADLARNEWKLFPDRLQPLIYVWAGVSVFAVTVVVVGGFLAPGMRRMLWSAAAAAVVVLACANQVNVIFAAYPTLADAVGARRFSYVALPEVVKRPPRLLADVGPIAMRWSPPPGLPRGGKLSSAPIPGSLSGFPARNAELYFPPAFFADPRPQLPVLILVPGQPGSPQDWLRGGKLVQTFDEFAKAHRGLAPVVVVVDGTGSPFGNPLCLDSRLGNAASYIARDVPAWIKANLAVDQEPQAWAVGGASYGGTCALQLATNYPDVYPTFLDISGGPEPSLGDQSQTIAEAFGGDKAAFQRINPLDLLRARRYPDSAGAVVVGADDRDTKAEARAVYDATRAAGMNTTYREVPGGHDWQVFSTALMRELPWLAQRTGLTQ